MGKTFIAAAAFAAALTGSAGGEDIIDRPRESVESFAIESIAPLLDELGVTRLADAGVDGVIAARYRELNFLIAPTACADDERKQCAGVLFLSTFSGRDFNQQTVNAFNYRYAFTSAGIDPSGAAFISRYEICDFGAPRGNVALALAIFLNQAEKFRETIAVAGKTASLEGYADDLSAGALNAASLGAMGVAASAAAPDDPLALHLGAFEASARDVSFFIAAEAAPANTITHHIGARD